MRKEEEVCDACGEGFLIERWNYSEITIKHKKYNLLLRGSHCSVCGSDLCNPEQACHNKRVVEGLKRLLSEVYSSCQES